MKLNENISCAVTEELVNEISDRYPSVFKRKGKVQTDIVLYALGFDVDFGMHNRGYLLEKDQIVRDNKCRHLTYKTNVYRGKLRKAVKFVKEGRVYYSKDWHSLQDVYEEYNVLQPSNLPKYCRDKVYTRIEDIGWY